MPVNRFTGSQTMVLSYNRPPTAIRRKVTCRNAMDLRGAALCSKKGLTEKTILQKILQVSIYTKVHKMQTT